MANWNERFLDMAGFVAGWSKDPSTKVGAVVVGPDREVLATGYNGFPRGVEDAQHRLDSRELKLLFTDHAERNCINHAARIGVRLLGATMYVTAPPCAACARAIIQAGIASVWCRSAGADFERRWATEMDAARTMFDEAGVRLMVVA